MKEKFPKVFISYVHQDAGHDNRENVFELANFLRSCGVEAMIDQFESPENEGWSAWMENKVKWADYILIVADKTYYDSWTNPKVNKSLKGSVYELRGIMNERPAQNIVPIYLSPNNVEYIPSPLKDSTHYYTRDRSQLHDLIKRLTGNSKFEPLPVKPRSDETIDELLKNFLNNPERRSKTNPERCFDQKGEQGTTIFCEHSSPFWEKFPSIDLQELGKDTSNLFFIPLTLHPHTTVSFTKARNLINKIEVGEFPNITDIQELSLWSTIGSSELMLKLRASEITFNQVVAKLKNLPLGKPMYRHKKVEALNVANEMIIKEGKIQSIKIPYFSVKYDENNRAVKAFIEIQSIEDVNVFKKLVSVFTAYHSVVIGLGMDASEEHMMAELFLPCGHFVKLCELTKRLDELEGNFLKQTFIGYHSDDIAN